MQRIRIEKGSVFNFLERLPILGRADVSDIRQNGQNGGKFNSEFATFALNNIRRNEICRGKRFYQMLHGCPIFLRSLSLSEHRLSLFRPNYNDRDYPINVY